MPLLAGGLRIPAVRLQKTLTEEPVLLRLLGETVRAMAVNRLASLPSSSRERSAGPRRLR
jgi:hypothetical protein